MERTFPVRFPGCWLTWSLARAGSNVVRYRPDLDSKPILQSTSGTPCNATRGLEEVWTRFHWPSVRSHTLRFSGARKELAHARPIGLGQRGGSVALGELTLSG